jgi:glycosyltransferase involved in cell wall biosynthesis
MDSPLVSVIVTVYNSSRWLPRLFLSLLNQTYRHFELIIVNDGSTDDSSILIRQFQNQFASCGIQLYSLEESNQGVGFALNEGLRNVHGDYFCWIDSDDYVSEEYLSILLFYSVNQQHDVVAPNVVFVYKNGEQKTRYSHQDITFLNNSKNQFVDYLFSKKSFLFPSPLISTKFYKKICPSFCFSPVRFSYDGQLACQIYLAASVYFVSEKLLFVSIRQESVSHSTEYDDPTIADLYLTAKEKSIDLLNVSNDKKNDAKNLVRLSTYYLRFLSSAYRKRFQDALVYRGKAKEQAKLCKPILRKYHIVLHYFKPSLSLYLHRFLRK